MAVLRNHVSVTWYFYLVNARDTSLSGIIDMAPRDVATGAGLLCQVAILGIIGHLSSSGPNG